MLLLLFCFPVQPSYAQEQVRITIPTTVTFSVSNIQTTTTGTADPFRISFTDAQLTTGHALRISVRADTGSFSAPQGTPISTSLVSWTTSNAQGGAGSNGTLSTSGFTTVFQSDANPTSGSIDLTWKLAAPGSPLRAGNHNLSLTWKIESVAL